MLHVLYGTDYKSLRKKLDSLRKAFEKKRPDAEFFTLDEESFSAAKLDEFIQGRGLFEDKYIVTLDRCFLDDTAQDEIIENLDEIAASPNAFILVAGELDATIQEKLENYAERAWEFSMHDRQSEQEEYTMFDLTDAFGRRDPQAVWVEYQQAIRSGKEPAAIQGMLFWQVKNMLLAMQTADADEAGMSTYPYKKATQFSKNFSNDELQQLSAELINIYHQAREGRFDMETKLEAFLLGVHT